MVTEDRKRAEPNKLEIRKAVETLDEIPVQYADTNGLPETKRKNFVAARDGLARAYATYRRELLPLTAKDAAGSVVVRVVKAIELSLNDRKGLHLDDLGAEIRRDIRAEWYSLLNPIIAGIFAAARKERDAKWSIVAEYFINKADALKDVRRNVDEELIPALENYYAAREGLTALIEEVK